MKVSVAAAPEAAWESNLIDDSGRKLDVSGDLGFDLRAYEIKTFKLQFRKIR